MSASTAAAKVTPDIDLEALADAMAKLGEVESALEYALPLDELEEMSQRDIDKSVLWPLDGFSSNLVLDVEVLAKLALRLRSLVNGGLTVEEGELAAAVGWTHA